MMDSSTLFPLTARMSVTPTKVFCTKVFDSCTQRPVELHIRCTISHKGCLRLPSLNYSCITSFKQMTLPLQACAAALESDVIADDSIRTLSECENSEAHHTVAKKNEVDTEPNVLDPNQDHVQNAGRRSWEGKDILAPLDALIPGAILIGRVTNIVRFGAFVDIGGFSSGLIHISNLTGAFVTSVEDVVKVGEEVKVKVLNVDVDSRRISLGLVREEADNANVSGNTLITDNGSVNIRSETKIVEGNEISVKEGQIKVEPTIEAPNDSHVQRVGNMYTPQVGKNTLVSVDALKPGVILTGKVTKIEKFGAFVDLGAYTTGLIHISNLSKSFVNSVEDIVKFGDEVQVVVLSVDVNSRRISLRLVQQDAESNQKKPFAPQKLGHIQEKAMRLNSKHSSKVARRPQKGETFNGSIARVVPNGAFVTLNEAHEGFLPGSEVLQGGQNVKMSSFFKIGQHVHVRVLRTTKQRIILTTVKQEKAVVDCIELDPDDGRATNPFEIAFRRDKVLTKFLQEREKLHSLRKDDTKDGPDSPSTG